MKALWIALANLRRMFRVRTNIFFVFVFPMVLILVLGATFGGSSSPRLGVVTTGSGPLGAALLRQFEQTPHLRVATVFRSDHPADPGGARQPGRRRDHPAQLRRRRPRRA